MNHYFNKTEGYIFALSSLSDCNSLVLSVMTMFGMCYLPEER